MALNYRRFVVVLATLLPFFVVRIESQCVRSATTVSGKNAPAGDLCSGQLLLNENFNEFDRSLFEHELTLGGGGNWEFQWYVDNPNNSFVKDGKLHIRPSLTIDTIGEHGLLHGHIKLDPCTNAEWFGCERQGTPEHIINPIRSARLRTLNSFSFKYGKLEIVAKLPTGDWLWPALWLLPTAKKYGGWPRSGEIDLMESRGNRNYTDHTGKQIGVEHFGSTLHFGPAWNMNGWSTATYSTNTPPGQGLNGGFHKYQMEWTPEYLKFCLDDKETAKVDAGDGFWARGNFSGENIWKNGSKMAPFDEQFHIALNLAVGGVNGYFPDTGNESKKPWLNGSPKAATDFWNGRDQWLAGWNLDKDDGKEASLIIDSIKVWAI